MTSGTDFARLAPKLQTMRNQIAIKYCTDDQRGKHVQDIYCDALKAATEAEHAHNVTLPPEQSFYCGFAWVEIRPARGPFVAYLKANGIGSKGWNGGWHVWHPSKHSTQSIGTKEAGAAAFADVLNFHGIKASCNSRLD